MKRRSAKADLETAVAALCDIALLHLQDAPTVDDARRIAQAALKAMEQDRIVVTSLESEQRIRVTSAAGNEKAEREMMDAMIGAINGILEAQGVPALEWKTEMIDDHPVERSDP